MHHRDMTVPLAVREVELPIYQPIRQKPTLAAHKFDMGAGRQHGGQAEEEKQSSESEGSIASAGTATSVDISPAAQFYSELDHLWLLSHPQYRQTLAAIMKQLNEAKKSTVGGELDLLSALVKALLLASEGDLTGLRLSASSEDALHERTQENAGQAARHALAERATADFLAERIQKASLAESPTSEPIAVVRERAVLPVASGNEIAEPAQVRRTPVVSVHSLVAAYGRPEPILSRAFPNPNDANLPTYSDLLQSALAEAFERLHADLLTATPTVAARAPSPG